MLTGGLFAEYTPLICDQAVSWCALPFPKYTLPEEDDSLLAPSRIEGGHKIPGHGEARVVVNFWFFVFVYYGFYNITALLWITKVFNIYSLNWYVLRAPVFDIRISSDQNQVAQDARISCDYITYRSHLHSSADTDILLP